MLEEARKLPEELFYLRWQGCGVHLLSSMLAGERGDPCGELT